MTPNARPRFRRAALACAAAAILSMLSTSRAASAARGDGVYGRLDGDLDLSLGIAGGVLLSQKRPVTALDARVRYFQNAGIVLQYEETDVLAKATSAGDYKRGFLAAVELRPLFPVRFLKGMESGHAFPDLVLDSLGLEIGAWWSAVEGASTRRPGLHVGLGVEVPLASRASGPWLRLGGALRWSAPRLGGQDDRGTRVAIFTLGLAWHGLVGSHVVDAGDRRVE
jgi:hypothetical protein